MMKMFRATLIVNLCILPLVFCAKSDAALSLTLDPPSGAIVGPAGSTVGWGFTLTNTSDFAVVSGSDFCVGVLTSPCSNTFGTYSDYPARSF